MTGRVVIGFLMMLCTIRLQSAQIITFGTNAKEWNQRLHVTGIRLGCSGMPAACVAEAERTAVSQGVSCIYLSFVLSKNTAIDYAHQYSVLSRDHPVLCEVAIDDFSGQIEKLSSTMTSDERLAYVTDVAAALKSTNRRLKFGITLYEDDVEKGVVKSLSQIVGGRIDIVHLYVHYRSNGPLYARYVRELKAAIPHAAIYAGAYAYDRIDYLPCAKGSKSRCSLQDERDLFRQALVIQKGLMDEGAVAAIEFAPALFGQEEEWSAWREARTCRAERQQECIDNTKALRQLVLEVLK